MKVNNKRKRGENNNKHDNSLLPVDTFSSSKALLFHALSNHQTGHTIRHSCAINSTVKLNGILKYKSKSEAHSTRLRKKPTIYLI